MKATRAIIKHEQGSALASVLTVIVVLTIIVGTILSVETLQHRFIHRDVERLQLLYEAEAGVYGAMQLLRQNPFLEMSDTLLMITEDIVCNVSVESVGGYYQIRSTAGALGNRGHEVSVRATIGEQAPDEFEQAIYLWDASSQLNVAGATIVNGDIEVGQRGIRQRTIAGIRYSGELNGVSRFNPEIKAPFFDDRLLQRSLSRFDQVISDGLHKTIDPEDNPGYESSGLLPGDLPVFFVDGDLVITQADSMLLNAPIMVVSSGDLILEGPMNFADGSNFLSGKRIRIKGQILGEDGVFYGRQSVRASGITSIKGQFLSRQEIIIQDSAYVSFPSLLFLGGINEDDTGNIHIQGRAIVEGSVVHGYLSEKPKQVRGRIIVEKDALVRGGIYNPYGTEIHGTVHGSVLTHHFFFYRTPTRYVNWLLDATIDSRLRPENYHVPLLFGARPDLKVIDWEVSQPSGAAHLNITG